jgi:hypothetical protein
MTNQAFSRTPEPRREAETSPDSQPLPQARRTAVRQLVPRALMLGLVAACPWTPVAADAPADSQTQALDTPRIAGLVRDTRVREISGIAASRRHPGLLWVHNDSGHPAQVHAIDARGRHRAALDIEGVAGRDFEDIAAFELDGTAYLLIADTGDHGGLRTEVELVALAEPERIEDARVKPAWTQRFRWPDGARDVEAVAVDVAAREVLLISKRRVPAQLFSLPLGPAAGLQTARLRGELAGIVQPTPAETAGNPRFGRYRAQITAADLSSDARQLAVLNYRTAYVYARVVGEDWAEAVTRDPQPLPFGWLAQAEAIAFDAQGRHLWITSERLPAPLIEIPAPALDE